MITSTDADQGEYVKFMLHSHPSYRPTPHTLDALNFVIEDVRQHTPGATLKSCRNKDRGRADAFMKLLAAQAADYPVVATLLQETAVEKILFLLSHCTRAEIFGKHQDDGYSYNPWLLKVVVRLSEKYKDSQQDFVTLYTNIVRKALVNQFAFICFHGANFTKHRTYEWRTGDDAHASWYMCCYHLCEWKGTHEQLLTFERQKMLEAQHLVTGHSMCSLMSSPTSRAQRSLKLMTNLAVFVLSRFAHHIVKMAQPRGCVSKARIYVLSKQSNCLHRLDYDMNAVTDIIAKSSAVMNK